MYTTTRFHLWLISLVGMADLHSRIPTVAVYGEFSPKLFRNSIGVGSPLEAVMKEFVVAEGLSPVQNLDEDDKVVVLFGTYAPMNSQSFRDDKDLASKDIESSVAKHARAVASQNIYDVLKYVSVSVQHVPHVHGHFGKKDTMTGGRYIGIDVYSKTASQIFDRLSRDYNYGPATIFSHGNGIHCDKRALFRHSANAFIPYARVPSLDAVQAIETRLNVSGCKRYREFAQELFEAQHTHAPANESEDKVAYTELADISIHRNLNYNMICVYRVH
jgi:hypothetical protein